MDTVTCAILLLVGVLVSSLVFTPLGTNCAARSFSCHNTEYLISYTTKNLKKLVSGS